MESLADALIGVLGLEFVYIRLADAMPEAASEVLRTADGRHTLKAAEARAVLADWLRPHPLHNPIHIANPIGSGTLKALFVQVGLSTNRILIAASRDPDFPND